MNPSEFFGKFKSRYLLGNIAAMILVVVAACAGVKYGLDLYTHHGESIPIPDVRHKSFADAQFLLDEAGMQVVVSDTGYVPGLKPDCILEQSPAPGERVKSGHIIYLIVNASHTPTLTVPDVIDNSSLREAMAKLSAMGFKLTQPMYVDGEREWVYGLVVKGQHVHTGDKVSINDYVTIEVGNGMRDSTEDINYTDAPITDYGDDNDIIEQDDEGGDVDEFHEVHGPEE